MVAVIVYGNYGEKEKMSAKSGLYKCCLLRVTTISFYNIIYVYIPGRDTFMLCDSFRMRLYFQCPY